MAEDGNETGPTRPPMRHPANLDSGLADLESAQRDATERFRRNSEALQQRQATRKAEWMTPEASLVDEVKRVEEAARTAGRGRQDQIEHADKLPPKPEPVKEGPQPEILRDPANRSEPVEPSLEDEVQRAEEAARAAARGQWEQIGRGSSPDPQQEPPAVARPETGHQKANREDDEKADRIRERYGDAAERIARKFAPGKEHGAREQGERGGRIDADDGGRGNEK